MPDSANPVRVPSTRDPRLDVFRGICLVMIFINHVPGTVFEDYTSRNFGFSDAAEGFVLMSGIAAGLAYSADFRATSMRLWTGLARVWRRVWTLYLVHILTTFAALAVAGGVALWLGNSELLFENQMKWVWLDPLRTLIGLVILTHQFGYVNILPLYLVLLAVTPLLLFFAWRYPLWLMAASVAVWLAAGIWRLGPPNYPSSGVWFFNPLAWQVIFITGLLTGVAMKDGRRFVPIRRWLQVLTGIFLIYAALSVQFPAVSKITGNTLWLAKETFHLPWNLTAFDKTYVTAPRLRPLDCRPVRTAGPSGPSCLCARLGALHRIAGGKACHGRRFRHGRAHHRGRPGAAIRACRRAAILAETTQSQLNLAGSGPVRSPASSVAMAAISASVRVKSKMFRFSASPAARVDRGITEQPSCTCQRKITCAGLRPVRAAAA